MTPAKDTRLKCQFCGTVTWLTDYQLFMRGHDRPDGRGCNMAKVHMAKLSAGTVCTPRSFGATLTVTEITTTCACGAKYITVGSQHDKTPMVTHVAELRRRGWRVTGCGQQSTIITGATCLNCHNKSEKKKAKATK